MTSCEKIYDDKIAPKLLEIGNICKENGIPFLAVVEYKPNKIARTDCQMNDEGLTMLITRHWINQAPNFDAFMMGLLRYVKEKNIDTKESIFINMFNSINS